MNGPDAVARRTIESGRSVKDPSDASTPHEVEHLLRLVDLDVKPGTPRPRARSARGRERAPRGLRRSRRAMHALHFVKRAKRIGSAVIEAFVDAFQVIAETRQPAFQSPHPVAARALGKPRQDRHVPPRCTPRGDVTCVVKAHGGPVRARVANAEPK